MDVEGNIEVGDILPVSSYVKKLNCNTFYNIRYGVVVAFTCNSNPRVTPIYHKDEDPLYNAGNKVVRNSQTFTINNKIVTRKAVTAGAWAIKTSQVCMNAYPIANKEAFLKEGKRRLNYNNILNIIKDEQETRKTLQPRKKTKVDLGL